jgi:hypothetical protein
MDRGRTYLTWILVGTLAGAATVSVLGVTVALGSELMNRSVGADDLVLAFIAAVAGAVWGGLGGAVAGLLGAAVSRALAARALQGPAIDAAVAAGVTAALAVPFWLRSWTTTSTGETLTVQVIPLLLVVAVGGCGGLLIWWIRSVGSHSAEVSAG